MTSALALAIIIGLILTFIISTLVSRAIVNLGFPLTPQEKRIGCVDGLRGYLALSVLVHHFVYWVQRTRLGYGWDVDPVNFFHQLGVGCVGLFFMVTGLVFYTKIIAGITHVNWISLYVTRFFRIVPLAAISIAFVIVVIALRTGQVPGSDTVLPALVWATGWDEPALMGYVRSRSVNSGVLWSLGYEWAFYILLLPTCALIATIMGKAAPRWLLPLVFIVIGFALRDIYPDNKLCRFMPLFAIGMLAYECRERPQIVVRLSTPCCGIIAALGLIAAMISFKTPYNLAMIGFGFFFICVACGNSMGGTLNRDSAIILGDCSFGIYLLHGLVLSIFFVDLQTMPAIPTILLPMMLPVFGAILVVVTATTHALVERPGINLGRAISKALGGRRPPRDAASVNVAP